MKIIQGILSQQLQQLLSEYLDIFLQDFLAGLPLERQVQHAIDVV